MPKSTKQLVVKGNQIISLVMGKEFVSIDYDPSFFFLKPVIMKDGFEFWEVASWERGKLTEFYRRLKRYAFVELLFIKKGMPPVFVQHSVPNLTEKQKNAVGLARDMGYYNFPRRHSLKELAAKAKVPRTTFQFHLRRAEQKLMDVLLT